MRSEPRPAPVGLAPDEAAPAHHRRQLRLLLLSFLMLFLELMLIRWAAANVMYVAYFTNFVLLASFLGIGVGFLRAGSRSDHFGQAPVVLAVLLGFVVLFPVQVGHGGRVVGTLGWPALPVWVSLPIIFVLVTAAMALVAEGVARTFATFSPLAAYRLDILGSLLGIAAFSGLAFLHAPPIVWGAIVAAAFISLLRRSLRPAQVVALLAIVLLLGAVSLTPHQSWSPYYKVSFSHLPLGVEAIKVNGLPHQSIFPTSLLRQRDAFYLYPYRHLEGRSPGDVLIVGAGNGNDVAVALSRGARHIDAVEIDPVIHSIGARDHPDHPYQDPRVSVHIDDGRAFLERNDHHYDLIIFALPDSLTLVSGQSSLRLESYLFTLQAMQSVRRHLRSGGVFTMYNYYRPDVFDRYAETITRAFGHPPYIDRGPDEGGPRRQAVLTVGLAASDIVGSTPWVPPTRAPIVATDDWPFPYLTSRSIPQFYLVTLLLILLGSLALTRRFGGRFGEMRPYLDLFFMGAAFLLLETKNVVQFALLFGTTWLVNALVFFGILLAVLLAVEVARRLPLPPARLLYLLLAAALVAAALVPPETLLAMPFWPRLGAAIAIAFTPVFLANLVFAQRFRAVGSSTIAFGANLLGAMVGGVLEYAALITGYRALLGAVFVLYLLAFLTRPGLARVVSGRAGDAYEPFES
ncbi:MAG TPA: spermidine synthase [Thermoleophilia bacterium]|nr:spermidine synthase [Thermoleophilia bacterium]